VLDNFRYQPRDEDTKDQPVSHYSSLSILNSAKHLCFSSRGTQALKEVHRSDMAARQWPGAGVGLRGGRGIGRPPAGGREVQRRAGPVHDSGDWFVERDAMQRRSREDGAERQFEGRRGSEPVFGRGGFRGRGGARGHVGRGGRSLQGSGRGGDREGQGHHGAAMDRISSRWA
jgi:hypothetical protein